MARGHSFQIVAAIPSQDAVIVRLGWTPEGQSVRLEQISLADRGGAGARRRLTP
jgi:hypothetical protein